MKTIVLICLMLSALIVSGAEKSTGNFVRVGNQKLNCDLLRVGKANTKLYQDGKKLLKIPTRLIDSYSMDGKLFEKMPIVCKNQDTAGWAFMQLISSKNGYKLYRFCSNCIHYDPEEGVIAPELPVYRYYIFRNGQYVSLIDEHNAKEQLASFGVKQYK